MDIRGLAPRMAQLVIRRSPLPSPKLAERTKSCRSPALRAVDYRTQGEHLS